MMKSASAVTTMEGPEGVSNSAEANSPPTAAMTPARRPAHLRTPRQGAGARCGLRVRRAPVRQAPRPDRHRGERGQGRHRRSPGRRHRGRTRSLRHAPPQHGGVLQGLPRSRRRRIAAQRCLGPLHPARSTTITERSRIGRVDIRTPLGRVRGIEQLPDRSDQQDGFAGSVPQLGSVAQEAYRQLQNGRMKRSRRRAYSSWRPQLQR